MIVVGIGSKMFMAILLKTSLVSKTIRQINDFSLPNCQVCNGHRMLTFDNDLIFLIVSHDEYLESEAGL